MEVSTPHPGGSSVDGALPDAVEPVTPGFSYGGYESSVDGHGYESSVDGYDSATDAAPNSCDSATANTEDGQAVGRSKTKRKRKKKKRHALGVAIGVLDWDGDGWAGDAALCLTFEVGTRIEIIRDGDPNGWWWGRIGDRKGDERAFRITIPKAVHISGSRVVAMPLSSSSAHARP